MPVPAGRLRRFLRLAAVATAVGLAGCADPEYDLSTPEKALDAAERMVSDGRADLLPRLIDLKPRDITFDDGVTEASAIEDVKGKLGEMLGRLWRVSTKLNERFESEVRKELALAAEKAKAAGGPPDIGEVLTGFMVDPFRFLKDGRDRLVAEDLSDGTAALLWDEEPVFGGAISMVETDEGWKFTFPAEVAQGSDFWPQTRQEWAVVAAMMLGIENSLKDFERELDANSFRSLRQASERVGRILAESVAVQSIIYAGMKRPREGSSDTPAETPAEAPAAESR
jgi:hypothetical protein